MPSNTEDLGVDGESLTPSEESPGNAARAPTRGERLSTPETFSVVGIGASAGGLKAFSQFFDALPEDPGMAFVLVQHLAPNHDSELASLLQTHTALPVAQVTARIRAEPGRVYVIPPGKALRIERGCLLLSEPAHPHGHRAPIDDFFRSLASDQGEQAVCIVLSGTGSDGSAGLRAVKEAGGLTLVQDPGEAQYDGMPRSAVGTGLVDVVLPVAGLAARLVELRRSGRPIPGDAEALPEGDSAALDAVFAALRAEAGHDFSRYKESTVLRRIGRRMQVLGVDSLADYAGALRARPDEAPALLRDLLISVTCFFRDPKAFEALEKTIPKLFEGKGPGDSVRVWVPGCATGEEAYSLAMLLCEHASRLGTPPALHIFASDIDEDALAFAREGVYPETIAADVTPERLDRFFEPEGDGYRVKESLREPVLFAVHNLLKDPPFSRLDLVSCRNLLIYLQRETQQRLFELFAYALREPGFLFLGTSESVEGTRGLFAAISKKHRVFRGRNVTRPGPPFPILRPLRRDAPATPKGPVERPPSLGDLHTRLLLAHHAPPSVIVGEGNQILHLAGGVGRYLTIPPGEPTHDLLRVAHPSLRPELRTALFYARDRGRTTDGQRVRATLGGDPVGVLLTVRPLADSERTEGLLQVVFEEAPAEPVPPLEDGAAQPALDYVEDELRRTRERLQSTIEEYETSNEELKASNEELLSMNEELQSTTEELETGREELQSINEELSTVNQELKTKIEELNRANADLQNLIDSTDVATLFLDRDLRITRYTPRLADLFNIIASDRGRPVGHLTQKIAYPLFVEDARQVLETLLPVEREVASDDDRHFLTRLIPYRTTDDRIDGVVATFVDITRRRRAEDEVHRRAERFRRVVAEAPLPVLLHAEGGEVLQLSDAFTEITGYTAAEVPTVAAWTRLAYGEGSALVEADIERLYALDRRLDEGTYSVRTKDGAQRVWQFSSSPVGTGPEGRRLVVSMAADVTERKQAEERLAAALAELETANERLEARVAARTAALRESEARLRLLYDVISQPGKDGGALVRDALEQTTRLLGLRVGILSRVEGDTYTVVACYAPGTELKPGQRFALGDTACSATLASDAPLALSNLADSDLRGHPCRALFGIESYVGTPVRVDGEVYGTLNFSGPEPTHPPFSESDRDLVSLLARWVEADLERTRAREQVERSERTLAGILLGSPDGIVALEALRGDDGAVEDFAFAIVNPAAAAAYGRRAEDLLGTRYLDCVAGTRESGFFASLVRVTETGEAARSEVRSAADGAEGWFDCAVSRLGDGVAFTFRDVTERRRLEREVIEAAELERRRIGQDLHDELGQQLTGAAFLAQVLAQKLAAQSLPEAEDADHLTALINEVLAETRDLSRLLSPVDVQGEGLADALQELTEQTERVFEVPCPLLTEGDVRVADNVVATHLFRIAQEAVNNALKHANPSEVTVRLAREEGALHLRIEDSGSGIDLVTAAQSTGLGLRAMRYRAALIGAVLRIVPAAGGTVVSVALPLPDES